ncbi:bifunctional (p)ppGpp synthetase/guanosine-3',5'-bis(diphosphate) 3'-pyrophosphohydrolase [Luteimonas pelagia]
MNASPLPPLDPAGFRALLDAPDAAALRGPLRDALLSAADAPIPVSDPPAVLAGTLEALARLDADEEVVAAAILRALPDLHRRLGDAFDRDHPAIVALVEGQQAAARVWSLHAEQRGAGSAEGLRRLLLAIVRDLRVVPILLARQLARLREAPALPGADRRALAALTRDIHAPLANRLGIWQLKWELEDLAFRHLEPETYQRIARLLDEKRADRERHIAQARAALEASLAAHGIRGDVAGRPKHIYSIWKKMQRKGVPIGELYDLRAVRVLVDDVQACYAALGVVHALWTPVPSEFDDYIARPKRNDYRSLHTAVVGPEGRTLEVQIRTHAMHQQAELGVAAHWKYKEGGRSSRHGDAAMEKRIAWMRRLLEAPAEGDAADLMGEIRSELAEDRVYVLTPRGEVIDLPAGATPLDFAYHVHTEVGHRCRGAKVDGRIVPLDHHLRSGDRVEILTGKVAEPRRDWLVESNGFLASARSREKVRSWFHKLDRARNVHDGREILEREFRRMGLLGADTGPVLARFNVSTEDDLLVLLALGDVGPHAVARALSEHERGREGATPEREARPARPARPARRATDFDVQGVGNLLVQVARCCQPLPGEAIAGYLTVGRGVTVHRADCAALARLAARQPQRVLSVEWGARDGGHEVDVQVVAVDRKGLLKDVSNAIAQADVHVGTIRGEPLRGGGRVRLNMRLRVGDFSQLSGVLGKLAALPGVEEAHRA